LQKFRKQCKKLWSANAWSPMGPDGPDGPRWSPMGQPLKKTTTDLSGTKDLIPDNYTKLENIDAKCNL